MDDHMEKMKENAVEFLLYSYFRKDFNKEKDIIEAAVEKAYGDATMRGAYNNKLATYINESGKKDEDTNKNNKENSKAAKENCINYLTGEDGIEKLIKAKSAEKFNKLHGDICGRLVDEHKNIKRAKYKKKAGEYICEEEGPCFTYGNAQKWVNMTMKNIYVICGGLLLIEPSEKLAKFCEEICDKAKYFHIPIDSYILQDWSDITPKSSSCIKMKGTSAYIKCDEEGNLSTANTPSNEFPWSSMDYNLYQQLRDDKNIRKKVQGNGSVWPIEWESKAWIDIANKRKKY